jgi:hypothetical protein
MSVTVHPDAWAGEARMKRKKKEKREKNRACGRKEVFTAISSG